ncbi:ATP-dependent DNA ligase [Halodesulfurarchaeum formicicum]|uniref:DNA ligase n=1 Tax=Halodesulfurarchaeum formicicum TaxID=1873524 RepID=A0A1J1ACZ9_9EURY|nr:ATP-dependent DNA ligase [Halodesulfurarchaeum formicicum]APE96028.1 DNA ligase 1 [Halodesulfurarchaeum formicicum]
MEYGRLVELYAELSATEANTEQTALIARTLTARPETVELLVTLLQGRPFVAWDDRDLGVSSSLTRTAIAKATGHSEAQIEEWWRETGDLGSAAARAIENDRQQTLFGQSLTVEGVQDTLEAIAAYDGAGSQERKVDAIAGLLSDAEPETAQYLVRTVLENLRIGVGEGTIRDAIAQAFLGGSEADIAAVERAYQVTNDYRTVAAVARGSGVEGLAELEIQVGRPIAVMLAEKAESVRTGMDRVAPDGPVLAEYKYDGMRAQVHVDGADVTVFTRRLADVTAQFPDVVAAVQEHVDAEQAILEGEIVGYDPETGGTLPFQTLSKRIKRKYDLQATKTEIPVTLLLFDAMYVEESLLEAPLTQRLDRLESVLTESTQEIERARNCMSEDPAAIEALYEDALAAGQEGIMVKNPAATYQPGNRVGYMMKVKPTLETLDLVVTRATYSEGRRSNQLGRLYLGCRDASGEFKEVGRLSTGFTDEELATVTERLEPLIVETEGRDVVLDPELVLEVEFEEIQASPEYDSSYALRFPRFVGFRDDLAVSDVDTLDRVERLYDQ